MKNFLNICRELFWPVLICAVVLGGCIVKADREYEAEQKEYRQAIQEAEDRGYERGFDDGYNLAKWEDEGELEQYKNESSYISEFELEKELSKAYKAGYEACLEEYELE